MISTTATFGLAAYTASSSRSCAGIMSMVLRSISSLALTTGLQPSATTTFFALCASAFARSTPPETTSAVSTEAARAEPAQAVTSLPPSLVLLSSVFRISGSVFSTPLSTYTFRLPKQ